MEIQAISDIYGARVEIFYQTQLPIVIYQGLGYKRIFRLYFKNRNHFDSIVAIEEGGGKLEQLMGIIREHEAELRKGKRIIDKSNFGSMGGKSL